MPAMTRKACYIDEAVGYFISAGSLAAVMTTGLVLMDAAKHFFAHDSTIYGVLLAADKHGRLRHARHVTTSSITRFGPLTRVARMPMAASAPPMPQAASGDDKVMKHASLSDEWHAGQAGQGAPISWATTHLDRPHIDYHAPRDASLVGHATSGHDTRAHAAPVSPRC